MRGHSPGTDWSEIDYWALVAIWKAYHMAAPFESGEQGRVFCFGSLLPSPIASAGQGALGHESGDAEAWIPEALACYF